MVLIIFTHIVLNYDLKITNILLYFDKNVYWIILNAKCNISQQRQNDYYFIISLNGLFFVACKSKYNIQRMT